MTDTLSSITQDNDTVQHSQWLAVVVLALLTFAVVTTEMLPIGLLNPIASTLDSSTGTAGLLISIPAIIAALFAPIVVLLFANINRRTLILSLVSLLIIANLMAALSSTMAWLLISRIIVGFCIGGIWAIAGGLALRLAQPAAVGLATSIIFAGISAASVFGVPIGVFIDNILGWRALFLMMAVFSFILLVLSFLTIPSLPSQTSNSIRQFLEAIQNKNILIGLFITLFLVSGHFMAFTFIRPVLQEIHALSDHQIGLALFAYGVLGMCGNFVLGMAAAKNLKYTLWVIIIGLIFSTVILTLTANHQLITSTISLLVWGFSYGGISVALMTWMMVNAPKHIEIASALYISVFNLAIGLGSFMGGYMVDAYHLTLNMHLATFIIFLTVFLLVLVKLKQKSSNL